jgi:hypothetical protein
MLQAGGGEEEEYEDDDDRSWIIVVEQHGQRETDCVSSEDLIAWCHRNPSSSTNTANLVSAIHAVIAPLFVLRRPKSKYHEDKRTTSSIAESSIKRKRQPTEKNRILIFM